MRVVGIRKATCHRPSGVGIGRPEHQAESKNSVLGKLAGEQPLAPFLREYTRHDGKRLLLYIHENLIRSRTNEILGIRSTLLDVTDHYQALAELRRLNKELDKRVAERTAELNVSNETDARVCLHGLARSAGALAIHQFVRRSAEEKIRRTAWMGRASSSWNMFMREPTV